MRFHAPLSIASSRRPAGLRLLLACLFLGAAASCASPGAGGEARLRVTLRDYGQGHHWELVSESHTNRVEYYSRTRNDAARKIQTDEVLDALVEELVDQGFNSYSQTGRAPSAGGRVISRSFEVQRGDDVAHWAVGSGSAREERVRFYSCVDQFLQLYNLSASYQTVENPKGREFFQRPPTRSGGGR